MSADMMIICKEDDSSFDGNNDEDAFFIDETSMGEPWSDFGKWFGGRYCGAPGVMQQRAGIREHDYIEFTEADFAGVEKALSEMDTHKNLDKLSLLDYLRDHIGKHISTENW